MVHWTEAGDDIFLTKDDYEYIGNNKLNKVGNRFSMKVAFTSFIRRDHPTKYERGRESIGTILISDS